MEIFAKRLKELRQEKEDNARDMGRLLGISHNAYLRYEHGNAQPTLESLVKLARHFNVTVDYLLGEAEV